MRISSPVGRVRDPVYTGSNRCWPCTAVNLVLVAVGAVTAATLVPAAGVGVAVLGVTAVWLRGYVVPGTPTLTRRYLPTRVLALFGNHHGERPAPTGDPTERLSALGVLQDGEPRLTPAFRDAWANTAADLAGDTQAIRRAAGETLAVPPADVAVNKDRSGIELTVAGDWVGQWPSQTALVADLATELALSDSGWAGIEQTERADLAARVRGVAEHCPVCESPTRVSEDTVASCCGSADVVAVTCPGCSARLAEFNPAPAAFAPGQ